MNSYFYAFLKLALIISGPCSKGLPNQLQLTSFGIGLLKHSVHIARIVEMAPPHEGHCMTAPLAHSSRRKNTRGPEDKSLQPFTAGGDAVLIEHAPAIPA
jgi:hypothetical protein